MPMSMCAVVRLSGRCTVECALKAFLVVQSVHGFVLQKHRNRHANSRTFPSLLGKATLGDSITGLRVVLNLLFKCRVVVSIFTIRLTRRHCCRFA